MSDVPAKVLPPMFLRLPNAVLINFLSEWLEIQDVGWLDGAMTTRALRPTFLQYLQDMRSTTVNGQTICNGCTGLCSCSFLLWLSIRRIYFEEITLQKLNSTLISFSLIELPFLRKAVFSIGVHGKDVIQLVKKSPALQSITVQCTTMDGVLRQIADHCPLLEELVPVCDDILMDDLLYLLNKCSTLTKLTLENPTTYIPHSKDRDWEEDGWELLRPYGHVMHQIRFDTKFPTLRILQIFLVYVRICASLYIVRLIITSMVLSYTVPLNHVHYWNR